MRIMSRHLTPILLGLLALCAVFALRLVLPDSFERMRVGLFDTYQRSFPWTPADSQVSVVDIDDQTLARLGQWPWPRSLVADLIVALQDAGVQAVGLDIVFSEPDRTSPRRLARTWLPTLTSQGDRPLSLDHLPDHDSQLAETIGRGRVVTGYALRPESNPAKLSQAPAMATIGASPLLTIPNFAGAIANLPEIDAAAAGSGTFTVSTGRDDVIRRIPVLAGFRDTVLPSLALETLRVALDEDTLRVRSEMLDKVVTGYTIRIGENDIPAARDGTFWLHHGALKPEQKVSAWRLLDPAESVAAKAALAGRIVLVGTSATGLADLRPTPLTPFEPGVNLHARAIEQIMARHFLSREPWFEGLEMALAALLASIIIILTALASLRLSIPLTVLSVVLVAAAPFHAFSQAGYLLDSSLILLAIAASFGVTVLVRTMVSERAASRLKSAFTHYLSPSLVAALARDPDKLRLGGELREMTFLFTDLEGFTSLIEKSQPEEVVGLLNEYLDGVSGIAMDHDGTIDKIVGDALHVMFNAPLDQPDHAERAVACALALDAFAEDFKQRQRAMGIPFGVTRIGVNTGHAVVGNFGGGRRFDYTAHGDAINTAARLEAANKTLGTRICVARSTMDRVSGIPCRPVGTLMLKGKTQGVDVFEPFPQDQAAPGWTPGYLVAFQQMVAGDPAGVEALLALHRQHPEDPILSLHAKRLEAGELSLKMVA